MKYIVLVLSILFLSSCVHKCEVCEVIKNGAMIEKYESCDDEGKKMSKEICEEMAKMQNSKCKCYIK